MYAYYYAPCPKNLPLSIPEIIMSILETIGTMFIKKKGVATVEKGWNSIRDKFSSSTKKDNKNNSKSSKNQSESLLENNCSETLKILKRSICFFQKHYLEDSLKASDNHRNFRLYLDSSNESEWDEEIVLDLCVELISNLQNSTSAAFAQFERDLQSLFSIQGKMNPHKPRICLKSIHPKSTDSETYIFDMERGREGSGRKWSEFPASLNTGFSQALETGNYYHCADIPTESNAGRYKNKRLSPRAVQGYMQDLSAHSDSKGIMWEKCWDTDIGDSSPDPSSCYKSTLIIPLTLSHSGIGDRALNILGMGNLPHARTTVGFLCFDHQDENYFTECDIETGYIYADNLSLYFFTRKNYINSSLTFSKAINFLRKKERIKELEERLSTNSAKKTLDDWIQEDSNPDSTQTKD